MSRPSFPALGFDPTPGDEAAVERSRASVATVMLQVMAVQPRLQQALSVTDGWGGDAADDFHDYGDDLPRALETGLTSARTTATALQAWKGQLTANQTRADALEAVAKEQKDLWEQTRWRLVGLGRVDVLSTDSADQAKIEEIRRLERRKERLEALHREVVAKAVALEKKHLSEADAAAARIKGSAGDAFEPANQIGQYMGAVSKVLSFASLGAAGVGAVLVATGVGLPVGAALIGASGAMGVASSAAGAGARLNHAPGAPSVTDIALGAATPLRAVAGGARAARATSKANAARAAVGDSAGRKSRAAAAARAVRDESSLGQNVKRSRDIVDRDGAIRRREAAAADRLSARQNPSSSPGRLTEAEARSQAERIARDLPGQVKKDAAVDAAVAGAGGAVATARELGVPGSENVTPGRKPTDVVAATADALVKDALKGGVNDK